MPFRSARCSLKAPAKLLRAALAAAAVLGTTPASAAISIVPANKGGFARGTTTIYYIAKYDPIAAGEFVFDPVSDLGFPFSGTLLATNQQSDAGRTEALLFDVHSNATSLNLQPGQFPYLVVALTGTAGGNYAVPIASVDGLLCGVDGNCRLGGVSGNAGAASDPVGGGLSTYYFAVPYSLGQRPVRIGLYPRDMCSSFFGQIAAEAPGCVLDIRNGLYHNVEINGAGSVTPLKITVQLQAGDGNGNLAATRPLGDALDSGTVSLAFQTQARTLNCPAGEIAYFPGDSQIFADTSAFDKTLQPALAGFSPIDTTIVVGKKGNTTPDFSGNFNAGNDLVARVGTAVDQSVGGFTNITSLDDAQNTYAIGFLSRDAAGSVTLPSGTGCVVTGVQTSEIQGFLAKSNCFIATAAFRSIDALPVVMLREFRDEVLLRSEWGTRFVRWYYRWSPPAAEWLMRNPVFRRPVLRALVPVEIAAWLALRVTRLGSSGGGA